MSTPTPVPDPVRGIGWTLGDLPNWLIFLFGVVTQLGDPWFLFVLLAGVYWFDPGEVADDHRRAGALLLALGVAAISVTTLLKAAFALPRPPGAASVTLPPWFPAELAPVYRNIATGSGFGFPSGHAIGSTIVYGGMALLLDVSTRRRRIAAAATLVALICLSRLVLGVHYLVDVGVGVGVGLAVLVLSLADPDRAFAAATLVGFVALAYSVSQGYGEPVRAAVAGVGAGAGGFIAWRAVGPTEGRVSPGSAGLALVAIGGVWVGAAILHLPLPLLAVGDAAAVAGVVALPALCRRI